MLQGLKTADRNAELHAGLGILDGPIRENLHYADGLGAHREGGVVNHGLERRQRVADFAQNGITADTDIVERDFRSLLTVDGRVGLAANALGCRVDRK